MKMPEPDRAVIAQRGAIIRCLQKFLPKDAVITDQDELKVYESDELTAYRRLPLIVAPPKTTDLIARRTARPRQRIQP